MEHFDVIVIGSGFGGAVMACRLAQQGRRVLVLERGKRWRPDEYPAVSNRDWFWREGNPEKHHGWIDFRAFGDMSVAAGCGVGGGSLIYANVSIDARPEVFAQGWPREISHDALRPYYQRVEQMLKPAHLPRGQWTRRTQLMQEAAGKLGDATRFRTVPQAISFDPEWRADGDDPYNKARSKTWTNEFGRQQGTCIHCGNCDIGCEVQAKNTLDLNYIPLAERHGAQVRPLHHVRDIAPLVNGDGYTVAYRDLAARRDGVVQARNVVVAAGSIGSTELLLRCRARGLPRLSSMLGRRWSANGDFVTPAYYPGREVSPTRGPTISSCIDYLDGSFDGRPVFIEDGGFPDLLGNLLGQMGRSWYGRWQLRRYGLLPGGIMQAVRNRDPLAQVMPWFGQSRDESNGELYLGRPWYAPWRRDVLKMQWDYRPNEAVMQAINRLHIRLSEETGGVPLTPPTWSLLRNLVTPHPLGGCAMADSPADGVVDHAGAVFGYPGLYVADGAVVPTSLGTNPSKTIAALAERAAEQVRG
ncbi:MAG: GMC oxidoreductase [Gammaproteobacteria bacterium]